MRVLYVSFAVLLFLLPFDVIAGINVRPFPEGVTAKEISELDIDDPLLESAYALALAEPGVPPRRGLPTRYRVLWQQDAYRDLARRGNAAVPILLKIMEDNQGSRYEPRILTGASTIKEIDIEPLLEYWRVALRERVKSLNKETPLIAGVFARHGTNEDIKLLRWFSEIRLDLEGEIHRELDNQKTVLRMEGKPILEDLESWELNRNLDTFEGSIEEFESLSPVERIEWVTQWQQEIAQKMEAADPPPPPPVAKTTAKPKAPETSYTPPPADGGEPTPPKNGAGSAVGLVAGTLVLLAGVWFVLRRKFARSLD